MIKVALFDAKAYDRPSFEHYGSLRDVEFRFLETKLNEDTVDLARGCDAVCVFVNDTVNAAVIDKLYAYGVKLIALRSAGYNNVDVKAAFGKSQSVQPDAGLQLLVEWAHRLRSPRKDCGRDRHRQDRTNLHRHLPGLRHERHCL